MLTIRMPEVVASAKEAVVARWLVSPGAKVAVGDTVAEKETEKAVIDLESEIQGTVYRIIVDEGESASIGAEIAHLLAPGEEASPVTQLFGEDLSASATPATEQPTPLGETTTPERVTANRVVATPLVRKISRDLGIDLSTVSGSGPNGRIVRADLADARPEETVVAPDTSSVLPDSASSASPASEDGELSTPSRVRAIVAERLTESKASVPHFYLQSTVEVAELEEYRRRINSCTEDRLTVTDLLLRAFALAIARTPGTNAIWTADGIRKFSAVDIGLAVDAPEGLMTPVLRDLHRSSLGAVRDQRKDLVERARTRRLRPEHFIGGVASVSNLGMFGIEQFTAILNPPQSLILAVGAMRTVPRELDGTWVATSVMTLTLSVDHRVIDGALAAKMMAEFADIISHPDSLAL
jgi:pyruvate dehydrogenase E2 component (dihydrolipoamide acetyltransferase)